jgi:hypothetical protein
LFFLFVIPLIIWFIHIIQPVALSAIISLSALITEEVKLCTGILCHQLKQITVVAGAYQPENQCLVQDFINEQPVRLNVALTHIFVISGICQSMIPVFLRQGLFIDKQGNYSLQFFRITAPLERMLVVFFELTGELDLKH